MALHQANLRSSYGRSTRRSPDDWLKYQIGGTLELPSDQTSYRGNIEIHDNKDLKNLGNLTELFGDLEIVDCESLEELGNLHKIHGNLYVNDCAKLASLGTLTEVTGFFICEDCPSLKSVGDLRKVGDVCSFINTGLAEFPSLLDVGISKTSKRRVQVFVPA
jgi:hypothetical protein